MGVLDQPLIARLDPQHAARAEGGVAFRDQREQAFGRDARRLLQLQGQSRRRPVNRDDPDFFSRPAQPGVGEEALDREGQTPVAILGLAPDLLQRLVVARRGDALVSPKALAHVGDVLFGDGNVNAEVDRDRGLVLDLLAAKLRDGALKHLRVKIEAEGIHVPRLLAAEEVACPA